MNSTFDAVARKSGNSIVVTIPKTTTEIHGIKNGTVLKVNIQKRVKYICKGCGKHLDILDIRVSGPGTLTWCNDCVEDGTQEKQSKELWEKYGHNASEYLKRVKGDVIE